ncbi:mitogen-activated protein kinase kinase kinase 3-like [Ipomoea triloba]|uniref:mitogen-activated protein kinase kinase kinase 3-like n=1 Tax=Ipomoea triloba TaxID=35885 RepID=UPI00125DFABB|nr:mitogen-activated protein kinase kinase kinase 3-like [Ipomoea triloba]
MPSCFGRNSMFDQEADLPRKEKKKKKTKQKAKSFTEAILVSARKSNNDDSVAPSSLYDPYRTGNTECPLPLPLPFYSSDSSARSRNSTSSISSISNYDEEIIITTSAPKLSLMQWGVSCESSPSHPRHPLPLPPTSPTTTCHDSKWKKGRLLGRGTFGHVYAGFNSENGRLCAIKEVRIISDHHTSKEYLKHLNQEIQILSQFSHPNIVQYYSSELREDKLCVYLEYVSGGSILKLLQDYGPFGEHVMRSYTSKILCGLVYLHDRNTAHRDIKGANILVNAKGDIKLADFGLAKHIPSSSLMLSLKGSPHWMAPEIVVNERGYGLAVDIWSLGCTVLEMATAKPPWSQYEGVAAMFKLATSKACPEIPTHLSEDAKSFIELCLQRDPSVRPTAAQLLHHPFVQEIH